jgi:glycosyltransferase involved in cell wall biosynthesis
VEGFGVADERRASERPRVSVIVPVRDGMPWLEGQLAALAAQEAPFEWEVVVADNGSRDGTAACVNRWAVQSPHIRWIDASVGTGPGVARNIGVRAARGNLLAFCDADDVVHRGWLTAMATALTGADLVAGTFDFGVLHGKPPSPPVHAAPGQLSFLPFGLGANLAIRREAFESVHGFSEELWPGEDVDLCWRLQLAGYRFAPALDAVVDKRERTGVGPVFRAAWSYGSCEPRLYVRYRAQGMRPDLRAALKSWIWLVVSSPGLLVPARRQQWARTFGLCAARLASSARHKVFFP